MPERMNFACFYERPKFSSPRLPITRVSKLMGNTMGQAVEAMLLECTTGRVQCEPFPRADRMLDAMPGVTETLFVYSIAGDGSSRRACISLHAVRDVAVVTASLPDMLVATDAGLVAEVCARLHAAGENLAQSCVVAAGGECEMDASLPTTAAALAAACANGSLAAWVACDADTLPEPSEGYVLVRRTAPNTALIRRR